MEYLVIFKEGNDLKIIGHFKLIKEALIEIGRNFKDEKDKLYSLNKALKEALNLETDSPLDELKEIVKKNGGILKLKTEDITKDNCTFHLKTILLTIFIEKFLKGELETDEELGDLIDFVLGYLYKGAMGGEE